MSAYASFLASIITCSALVLWKPYSRERILFHQVQHHQGGDALGVRRQLVARSNRDRSSRSARPTPAVNSFRSAAVIVPPFSRETARIASAVFAFVETGGALVPRSVAAMRRVADS